jgi:pimeloyl-ACP methyl ester carboxylesterase
MMMKSFSLSIPGFSIAGKAWGNPNATPILALHGWLDNANSFDLIAPYLSQDFYLIAIDLPGHGHSSHLPQGCYYHLIDGIYTVIQIMDALNYARMHLLGHSLGGCLASLVAGIAPNRVISAAFIDALGPLTCSEDLCQQQLTDFLHHGMPMASRPSKPYSSLKLGAKARAQRGYLSMKHAELLCERGMYEEDGAFYWRHDKRLLAPSPLRLTEGQVLSCLATISAKSLLCCAEQGFAFNEKDLEARIAAMSNLTIKHLPGGHHIHMEQADVVGTMLVEFFKT